MTSFGRAYSAEARARRDEWLRQQQNSRWNKCMGTVPESIDYYGPQPNYDYTWKVVLIGDARAGKTSLCRRYIDDTFEPEFRTCNLSIGFQTKLLEKGGKQIRIRIFDTHGEERYLSVSRGFYREAVGAFLVFDIANHKSFESLERWLNELREYTEEDSVIIVLGNKCDLEHSRAVTAEEIKLFTEENKLVYMEVSALDATNVNVAFRTLLNVIYTKGIVKERMEASKNNKDSHAIAMNSKDDSLSAKYAYCNTI